jgi:O-antigen/teichoic acid export membrane protein
MSSYLKAAIAWCQATLHYNLQSAIAQNSLVIFLGHLIRQALGLISSALLARSLGPEGLSLVSVIGAATSIGSTVADCGLSNGAIRHIAGDLASRPDVAHRVASSYVRLKLLAGMLMAGCCALFAGPIAHLLNLPAQSGQLLIWIACLGLLAGVFSGITGTLLQALRRFQAIVTIQSATMSLTILLIVCLFLTRRLTVAPALLVGAITSIVAAGLGLWFMPRAWRSALLARGQPLGPERGRLLSFSRWMWISAIFSILSSQLDLLLLNWFAPPQTVGFYALALNLAFKADLVNQTLHTVLLPTVSALSGSEAQRTFLRRSLDRNLMLGAGLAAALPLARPFIVLVYGEAFAPSTNVFYLLMAIVLFDLFTNPLLLLAFPLNMPRLLAASDVVRVITLVAFGALLLPVWGVYGMALAKLIAKLAGALVTGIPVVWQLRKDRAALQAP